MGLKKLQFEWDQWNIQKNELKHGIASDEAESVFSDTEQKIFEDPLHSTKDEARHVVIGKSLEHRVLMVGFTVRKDMIRVITARPASRKERLLYEKA